MTRRQLAYAARTVQRFATPLNFRRLSTPARAARYRSWFVVPERFALVRLKAKLRRRANTPGSLCGDRCVADVKGFLCRPSEQARCRVAVVHGERLAGGGDVAAVLEQGALVVLDLDDQGDFGLGCAVEQFFGSVARPA